jgi:uncharacterized linocin/CFP29 family protein
MGAEEFVTFVTNARRPRFRVNSQLAVNSILLRREWEALDAAIIGAARQRLNVVADMRAAGLVQQTGLGEMVSSWRVGSQRARPSVTMDGRTAVDRDRTERRTSSVPIPIIATEYEIGRRELLASRSLGAPIDTYEAEEAGRSVTEEVERIVLNGNSDVIVQGNQIYGLTNHPDRLNDTASNYGGGDFGTVGNATKAILGAIGALSAISYYGPFYVYIAPTQYNEAMNFYDDGSGDTDLDRIRRLDGVANVKPADLLADEEVVMVQATGTVVDLREAMGLDNREWEAPDGSAMMFKVMQAIALRLKPDYSGNLGVLHMTGA